MSNNNMYSLLWYHARVFHYLKNSQCFTYSPSTHTFRFSSFWPICNHKSLSTVFITLLPYKTPVVPQLSFATHLFLHTSTPLRNYLFLIGYSLETVNLVLHLQLKRRVCDPGYILGLDQSIPLFKLLAM